MHLLLVLVLALMSVHGSASAGTATDIAGSGMREILLKTQGNLGSAVLLTDEHVDKIVDFVTAGCYTDPELVPGALKQCVGTSANLLHQVVDILQSSVVGVYTTSSEPTPELFAQAVCFVRGLNLITDDGSLNELGVNNVIDSMRDSADLRIYAREAIQACANSESKSEFMALCIQKALLQKCNFVEL